MEFAEEIEVVDEDAIDLENMEEANYEAIDHLDITSLLKGKCCMHNNIINEGNIEKCEDCGLELNRLSLEPEWRNYENDSKGDMSRCHPRKDDNKNIYKDLEQYNLPMDIVRETNNLYIEVTRGKILRANNRKAIIYACIQDVYKQNIGVIPEDLATKFGGLSRKDISKGAKEFKLATNKTRKNVHLSPLLHIDRLMSKFNSDSTHIDQVKALYEKIKNRNTILNRSHQISVMCGLIYYYWKVQSLTDKTYDITCEKYSHIVGLSLITITKIAKIISQLLDTIETVKL